MSEQLRSLLAGPTQDIDLAQAALLVASHASPEIDIQKYRRRIEEMTAQLSNLVDLKSRVADRIDRLNRYFFGELGFAPNISDYFDPRNSLLNEVIDRRTGIPITLSLLYMEIGRGAGLSMRGINFPGHFLVRCEAARGSIILDPYSLGASLDEKALHDRLAEIRDGGALRSRLPELLAGADKKDIVIRMLRNLKAIYLRDEKFALALPIVDWIVAASPGEAMEIRDRGFIYQELECFRAAVNDFESYLALTPAATDVADVRARLTELRPMAARLN
jgi:regulator of sirC expression with transglutaminase-like and TPR domain